MKIHINALNKTHLVIEGDVAEALLFVQAFPWAKDTAIQTEVIEPQNYQKPKQNLNGSALQTSSKPVKILYTGGDSGKLAGIPTKYLDKAQPKQASDDDKNLFLGSIKPSINIDINSRQGLRQRIIATLLPQKRIAVSQIFKASKTNDIDNVKRAIQFLREAGCVVRVEHYYKQHGKEYFDNNLGPTSLITLMSIGTPTQGRKARTDNKKVWQKYYKSTAKPAAQKSAPVRVVEAQKLLDTPTQQ